MTGYSCYLIGEDHLLHECGKILMQNDFDILGVITDFAPVISWSIENDIPHFSMDANFDYVLNKKFDYLISVVNGRILTPKTLSLATKMNINFHNAPLPKYAGVHAVSWAILNEEKQHGVTWHEMVPAIDGGDILEQSIFAIDADETALSLSVKCYEEAIRTFADLVLNLKNNSIQKTPQNISLRTYYSLQKKPKDMGWINWNDSAFNIQKMCRAFSLGHYSDNTFLSAKFIVDEQLVIVDAIPALGEKSTHSPGSIVKRSDYSLEIATKTNNLIFSGVFCINKTITQASIPNGYEVELYRKECQTHNRNEKFWVRELQNFESVALPFQPLVIEKFSHGYKKICDYHMDLTKGKDLFAIKNSNFYDVALTLLLIYIHKVSNSNAIGVKFNHSRSSIVKHFFSDIVPFNIKLDEHDSFCDLLEVVFTKRRFLNDKGCFQRDVFSRYPNLSDNFLTQEAIHILFNSHKNNSLKYLQGNIAIIINKNKQTITWYLKKDLVIKKIDFAKVLKLFPEQMQTLVNAIVYNHKTKIISLSILSASEREKILNKFRLQTTSYPKDKTLMQLFEEIVKKNPNKIAITDSSANLTYNQLNNLANYLANYLFACGLGINKYAAICANNEINTIICILAILKTGAAYIPINSSYPITHIKNILKDCNPLLFLTDKSSDLILHQYCEELHIKVVIYADKLDKYIPSNLQDPKNLATPLSLAYVIYTSGTTGEPKGVMVNNRAIIRLVKNTNYIKIQKNDVIAQAASIGFDAATFEIWGAFLNGCKLVVVNSATLLNINKFSNILFKEKVSILWLTSALFNQFASINKNIFKALKYLLVGGDVLNTEIIFSVLDDAENRPKYIVNGYGPTENTTFTTTYNITNKTKQFQSIPIGKGIANTSVYILDKNLQLAPLGVHGELYTGGDGLAMGYLNKPLLTEQKFIPNQLVGFTNEIIYKTGDIVCWMPDGNINYIGRTDNQIKISGFRIEIEGIQTHILHHPNIQQCYVVATEDTKKIKTLVAYVVASKELTSDNLRVYLAKNLPNYMIPKFFIFVKTLPLTINGKVDKSNLPKPNLALNNSKLDLPKTPMQEKLKCIWEELFKHDKIGVKDNFFEIGGHSLLLTHLVMHLKREFNFDLVIHKFLEHPTIEMLETLILSQDLNLLAIKNSLIYKDLNQKLLVSNAVTVPMQVGAGKKSVFLTGSTGFLGAHILADLCKNSFVAKVYCLVRADNISQARGSIEKSINKYCLDVDATKIYPILGDLSQHNLGIAKEDYIALAREVDLIIHNGAQVNHILNYAMLRATNVNSTKELIILAATSKVKSLHFVSTLSAACNHVNKDKIKETIIEIDTNEIYPQDGYSQTKWVSEILLSKAQKLGIPVKIYRPGWIIGQSTTGIMAADNNHLYLLIKGCLQLQYVPNWDININLMPVDIVSNFIVKASLFDNNYHVFNLIHPDFDLSWKSLFNYLKESRKYNIHLIPDDVWSKNYLDKINFENAMYSIYSLYVNQDNSEWTKELSKITLASCCNTKRLINEYSIHVNKLNKQTLDIHFDYLSKNGFLT